MFQIRTTERLTKENNYFASGVSHRIVQSFSSMISFTFLDDGWLCKPLRSLEMILDLVLEITCHEDGIASSFSGLAVR